MQFSKKCHFIELWKIIPFFSNQFFGLGGGGIPPSPLHKSAYGGSKRNALLDNFRRIRIKMKMSRKVVFQILQVVHTRDYPNWKSWGGQVKCNCEGDNEEQWRQQITEFIPSRASFDCLRSISKKRGLSGQKGSKIHDIMFGTQVIASKSGQRNSVPKSCRRPNIYKNCELMA